MTHGETNAWVPPLAPRHHPALWAWRPRSCPAGKQGRHRCRSTVWRDGLWRALRLRMPTNSQPETGSPCASGIVDSRSITLAVEFMGWSAASAERPFETASLTASADPGLFEHIPPRDKRDYEDGEWKGVFRSEIERATPLSNNTKPISAAYEFQITLNNIYIANIQIALDKRVATSIPRTKSFSTSCSLFVAMSGRRPSRSTASSDGLSSRVGRDGALDSNIIKSPRLAWRALRRHKNR